MIRNIYLSIIISLLGITQANAYECSPDHVGCVEVGHFDVRLAIGAGIRTNPIVGNDDVPLFLLPEIFFYGKRVFFDVDTLGYTLLDRQRGQLNVVGTISYHQIYFQEFGFGNLVLPFSNEDSPTPFVRDISPNEIDDPQTTPVFQDPDVTTNLHSRNLSVLGGVEYNLYNERWMINVQMLRDISRVHDGASVRAVVNYPFNFGGVGKYELLAGLVWEDSNLLDYYYGVREYEAREGLPAYRVNSDFSAFVRLQWRKRLSKKWELMVTGHYRYLGDEVAGSPIVESDGVSTIYAGGVYHF